ncbi:MAG: VanW family protein [Negativibacillus sp.]
MQQVEKPVHRSTLRLALGERFYSAQRRLLWLKMERFFAKEQQDSPLLYCAAAHQTILLRKLKDVDMWLQENKIVNLRIAAKALNGVLLRPGQIFSYWRLIGKPTKKKGYVEGMILRNGGFTSGVGGGLCQLSNLIFWMTLHTPLTVIERHRHGYDVFPDSNRTQPFGSGATCFYPNGDLMIRNDTSDTYQLVITVGDKYLKGEWRVSSEPQLRYEVEERNHTMTSQYWGGYTRHNQLYQLCYDRNGSLLGEKLAVENTAIMMYPPFLSDNSSKA